MSSFADMPGSVRWTDALKHIVQNRQSFSETDARTTAIDGLHPWSARVRTEPSRRLLKVMGLLLVIAIAWATFFQIDKVTRGAGRVLPSVQNQVVQHLEGGIVKQILVREGQRVRKGDILLKLSNQQSSAELNNAQTDVAARHIALARLEAEAAGASSFTTHKDLARLAPDIAASEEAFFRSRHADIQQQMSVFDRQIQGYRAEIGSAQSRIASLRAEERMVQNQLDRLQKALLAEAVSETAVLEKQTDLQQLRTRISDAMTSIPKSQADLSETVAKRGEAWTRYLTDTREKAATLRLEVSKAGQALNAYQDRNFREEVRAPMDGYVNKILVQTVGGVAKPGDPLVEIVPADKLVVIEARVAPRDRGNIWPGLPAVAKISAYDSAIYGGLDATVDDISPDAIQDPKGELYYRVRLRADTGRFGPEKPVLPGMTAEVDIRSGHQSILDYILGPFIRIRDGALRE